MSEARVCCVLELVGLAGIGKTMTARAVADRLEAMGHRPRLRGEPRGGGRISLMRTALARPRAVFGLVGIAALTGWVAAGSVRWKVARAARMTTGLMEMLHAFHRSDPLIMDEGPLVWAAAIRWGWPRLARRMILGLATYYATVPCVRVVSLVGDTAMLRTQRKIRKAGRPASKYEKQYGPEKFPDEKPHKHTDAERARALKLFIRLLRVKGVPVMTVQNGDPDTVNAVITLAGWNHEGLGQ